MLQHYINHVGIVLDKSGSMMGREDDVVKVFDNQIAYLARRSKELNQETRVSVYLFSKDVECLVFDMDVLRIPSLGGYYTTGGQTALLYATQKCIKDLQKTPELYGDHAFLIYVVTDGQENASVFHRVYPSSFSPLLYNLPSHWTVGVFVPNVNGVGEAKKFGFPPNSISVWNVEGENGIEEVGEKIRKATDTFMENRAKGVRGTKNLFILDASSLDNKNIIKNTLTPLSQASLRDKVVSGNGDYVVLNVRKSSGVVVNERGKIEMELFVNSWLGEGGYRSGSCYYQLTKPEKIQSHKNLLLMEKRNGKVYSGEKIREFLGLPSYEVKVHPLTHPLYDIFVQSKAPNRILQEGTTLLVLV